MRIAISTHHISKVQIMFQTTALIISSCMPHQISANMTEKSFSFDETRAFNDLIRQTEFGSRIPGSSAHAQTIEYITGELKVAGWSVQHQEFGFNGFEITNIIARSIDSSDDDTYVLIGAHYDSRMHSDSDPMLIYRTTPVPGANDGASGVAAILEIARIIPPKLTGCVRFVFFDGEDNGNIADWDWIMGSRHFVSNLSHYPSAVVILDMIGDIDLNIYKEINSDSDLTNEIWQTAYSLGYERYFIDSHKHQILDDHVPFLEAGIPAVDIIDIDYPYWHTSQDTYDKTSAESLRIVGETVTTWLTEKCRDLGF